MRLFVRKCLSAEERKKWYKEIGHDMGNPEYRIEARPYARLFDRS